MSSRIYLILFISWNSDAQHDLGTNGQSINICWDKRINQKDMQSQFICDDRSHRPSGGEGVYT